jgi:hypothetical protein
MKKYQAQQFLPVRRGTSASLHDWTERRRHGGREPEASERLPAFRAGKRVLMVLYNLGNPSTLE